MIPPPVQTPRDNRAKAYYNENDRFAAAWLRELITAGLIADGDVDERSIEDVTANDVRGYTQCHWFAGVGGWAYALTLSGWGDRACWTGSCPCQPHSSAARGRSRGFSDPRDLWPAWFRLIAQCRPRVVFGEQVAHQDAWIDRACADLEAVGYEVGAAVLPAISVGQDHARHRMYFAGYANRDRESIGAVNGEASGVPRARGDAGAVVRPHGVSARVVALSGFGNAIVPQVAQAFIEAYLDAEADRLTA